jgi:hypothetical protein
MQTQERNVGSSATAMPSYRTLSVLILNLCGRVDADCVSYLRYLFFL